MFRKTRFLAAFLVVFFLLSFWACQMCLQAVERVYHLFSTAEEKHYQARLEKKAENRYSTEVSRSYKRTRIETFEITAYTLDDCDKTKNHPLYGVAASGKRLTAKDSYRVVAVDNHRFRFGTRMKIHHPSGPIYVTAVDTGGDIVGNRLDLFINDKNEALRWGRKRLQVEILE